MSFQDTHSDNGGRGAVLKVDIKNPQQVSKVKIDQFFPALMGYCRQTIIILHSCKTRGVNKIFKLATTDNWQSAKVTQATQTEDRFANPATSTMNGSQLWIMNSKFNELSDSNSVPSKKFNLQLAVLKPVN